MRSTSAKNMKKQGQLLYTTSKTISSMWGNSICTGNVCKYNEEGKNSYIEWVSQVRTCKLGLRHGWSGLPGRGLGAGEAPTDAWREGIGQARGNYY